MKIIDNKSLEIGVNQVQINSKNVTLPQTGTDNKLSSMLGFSLMASLVTFALAGVKRSKVEK